MAISKLNRIFNFRLGGGIASANSLATVFTRNLHSTPPSASSQYDKDKLINFKNHEGKYEALDKYGTNLTELARRGKLDPIIGREDELLQCMEILSSRTKNSPIIIGDPGVGKTAIVEELAQRIMHGDVPKPLLNRKLISLNMGSLVAGARDRGVFVERLVAVLKEVAASNGEIILFIDDIHIIGYPGLIGGIMNVGHLLKPKLDRGELRCIGATSLNEYKKYIKKDPTLERRFPQVFCGQSSVEDTPSILRGLQERYELHHGVKISDSALVSTVVLVRRYLTERGLPDKAIDLVEEVVEKLMIEITSKSTELDENDALLKQKQREWTEQWDREKSFMARIEEDVVLSYLNSMSTFFLSNSFRILRSFKVFFLKLENDSYFQLLFFHIYFSSLVD